MGRKPWTPAGIARLDAQIATYQERVCCNNADRMANSFNNSMNNGGREELMDEAQSNVGNTIMLANLQNTRAEVEEMPRLVGTKNVRVGHGVKLIEAVGSRRVEHVFIVGGSGESYSPQQDLSDDIQVISCDTPIGRALIKKSAGDDFTVKTANGERSFELVEVFIPGQQRVAKAA